MSSIHQSAAGGTCQHMGGVPLANWTFRVGCWRLGLCPREKLGNVLCLCVLTVSGPGTSILSRFCPRAQDKGCSASFLGGRTCASPRAGNVLKRCASRGVAQPGSAQALGA